MLKRKSTYLLFLITLCSWGFSAHKDSHAIAITGLPSPIFDFCKIHEDYIISEAVADRRKFNDTSENVKHYIDLDLYDSTASFGILPWVVQSKYNKLVWALTNCEDTE